MSGFFSHSRLGCFEKCPRQFRYRYVDRIPAPTEGIEAFVGKRVHDVLERLYRFVGEGRVPGLAAVLRRFASLWEEKIADAQVRIARQGTELSDYQKLGEQCLSNFYRANYPFDGEETVAIEERVTCSLDGSGAYRIQGFIDRLARSRDGQLEIHDYKTGRRMPSQNQLDEDRQLALYEMAVRERYAETGEIRLVWHFLQRGRVRSSRRSADQLAALRARTIELIDRIRGETEYPARPSPLCGWCEYNDICPASPVRPAAAPRMDPAPPTPPPAAEPPAPLLPRGQLSLL
ncbi:MAG: PD-(D/E)XK nuclease family protein [Myxococcota bacterium]